MKLSLMKAGLKKGLAKTGLALRKKSPLIFTIVGIGAVVTGEVLACKATLKMKEIKDEAAENLEKGKGAVEKQAKLPDGSVYTAENYEDDVRIIKKNEKIDIFKAYLIPVLVTAAGIFCIGRGYKILSNRYSGMVVAYEGLRMQFDKYRKRVLEDAGRDKDQEYMHGKKIIEKTPIVDENGEVVGEKITETRDGYSEYTVLFDEYNPSWVDSNILNAAFLRKAQAMANDRLKANGHVFLNEVWEMVDYHPTDANKIRMGRVCGWVEGYCDGFIDFGCGDFFEAVENGEYNDVGAIGIALDFNCSGNILSAIE